MTNDDAAKIPPPTPDGREGRLFPPEQSWKKENFEAFKRAYTQSQQIFTCSNRLAQARPAVSSFPCVIWMRTRLKEVWLVPC
jgi:hypothetical protein